MATRLRSGSPCLIKITKLSGGTFLAGLLILWGGFLIAQHQMGPLSLAKAEDLSTIVLDRNGALLRAFTTRSERWRLPLEANEVDGNYIKLLLAYEDKRFFHHHGIDPVATMRAFWQLVRNGRIISGASTLTMQVARLLEPRDKRTLFAKLRQSVRAIELERRFSKTQILSLYLRLAPFGGNIEGARAASLAYFGREPRHLSLSEAALLVALPQSPEMRRPDRRHKRAQKARDRVLLRAAEAGVISLPEARRATRDAVPSKRKNFPKLAPHLARAEMRAFPKRTVHHLTIDKGLQQRLQKIAQQQAARLGDKHSLALLAIEHDSGKIRAYVGSPDFLDDRFHGPINMIKAMRSPGSALKPFVYGLAFEDGLANPETLIDDEPTRFGTYKPKNFDHQWHGTLSVRKALQMSLNVPAVKLLDKVGPARLLARFRQTGIKVKVPTGTKPNLSMVLGGLGITIKELGKAYAGLARGGEMVDLVWRKSNVKPQSISGNGNRLMNAQAAWQVANILADAEPPKNARRGQIAYKTGTSYGYRDAWAAGFDGQTTIIVWAGRPDGTPSPGLTGRSSAAPALFAAFEQLGRPLVPLKHAPKGTLIAHNSNDLPAPLRHFERVDTPFAAQQALNPPVKIAFPHNGSQLSLSLAQKGQFETLALKAEGGKLPLTWMINGAPIKANRARRRTFWKPREKGFVRLGVLDALGRADSVMVRIE
ncbi:MAG: penicillin-binding protein 1C [Hyphomicrobiaceae bacterium]|nr:penicillin-binding protein 1C [Hyphomicrobiaceae bacterium]